MIKPIVNLSKVADNYDTFLLGFNGVVTDGNGLIPNVAATLNSLHKTAKSHSAHQFGSAGSGDCRFFLKTAFP